MLTFFVLFFFLCVFYSLIFTISIDILNEDEIRIFKRKATTKNVRNAGQFTFTSVRYPEQ